MRLKIGRLGLSSEPASVVVGGGATGYRYLRWNVSKSHSQSLTLVAEFAVMQTLGGADVSGGKTYSASEEATPASNAFDDNNANYWYANSAAAWIRIDCGASSANWINPVQYSITAGTGGLGSHAPEDFTFEVSADGSAWTVLDTRTALIFADGETKTFTIP